MTMFGRPMIPGLDGYPGMVPVDPFGGVVNPLAVAGAMGVPTPTRGNALGGAPGPAGPMNDAGPSSINLTGADRYGTRPSVYGGGLMQQLGDPTKPTMPQAPSAATAAAAGGMFGAQSAHKASFLQKWGPALAMAALAFTAKGNPAAGAEMEALMNNMAYQRKKSDSDAQTAQYVQALVANGMDPNMAVVLAADPGEMAKHIGTRFDAQRVDEGSSVYTPNLNGTSNIFTAPKTFKEGADVVQAPGSQTVAPAFSTLGGVGVPQPLGAPASVPGLRTEAEQYASQFGSPGTPAFNGAVQDYTLKANGPTAFGNSQALQDARLSTQREIAAGRNATSTANNLRSTQASRYGVDHRTGPHGSAVHPATPTTVIGGIMDKQARGEPLTAAEQSTLKDYRTHYKPQRGAVQIGANEAVAVGPHGERLVVRNGAWVNSATGKPVQ